MVNTPAMLLLWGAVFTAMILAVRSAVRRPIDPPAHMPNGRSQGVAGVLFPRSEPNNDNFYRRLM